MKLILTRLAPAIAILLLAGCFETKLSLGPNDKKVDPAYCGDWQVPDTDKPNEIKATIAIRNLDGKQYFVDWNDVTDKTKEQRMRFVGHLVDVKGIAFAQLRALPPDGSIADKHAILRIELKDDKLTIRNLDDKFFNDKPLNTDADFRKFVEDNLDNAGMYDEDAIIAMRVVGK